MKKLTLWIISPSWGPWQYYRNRIKRCIDSANKLWFEVKFMKYALNSNWYIADTPEHRAQDLTDAFADPEVDIVMTMIGWNHSNQILKYIDWEVIKNNPKPFVWYSDITVLHHAIYTKTWIKTYYGPAFITQFGNISGNYKYTFEYFKKILIEKEINIQVRPSKFWTDDFVDWTDKNPREKEFIKNNWWKWLRRWKAIWEITWWCVPSINHLFWTEYLIDSKDKIFFVDIPEDFSWPDKWLSIANLDAFLADLDNIWVFDHIKGLVIWRPYRYSFEQLKELEKILLYYTKGKKYPVLLWVDIWHTDPMITVQYLSNVLLDSEKNLFILNYKEDAIY